MEFKSTNPKINQPGVNRYEDSLIDPKSLNEQEREQFILKYMPLVKSAAFKILSSISSKDLDLEDLKQIGIIGLLSAMERYDPKKGSFSTFAEPRIKGAIIDHLRKQDTNSVFNIRTKNKVLKALKASEEHQRKQLTPLTNQQMADHADLSLETFQDYVNYINNPQQSYEDFELLPNKSLPSPEQALLQKEQQEVTKKAIEKFWATTDPTYRSRDQKIYILYYVEEKTLKQIGQIVGLGESRVSQILTHIIEGVKKILDTPEFGGRGVDSKSTSPKEKLKRTRIYNSNK